MPIVLNIRLNRKFIRKNCICTKLDSFYTYFGPQITNFTSTTVKLRLFLTLRIGDAMNDIRGYWAADSEIYRHLGCDTV